MTHTAIHLYFCLQTSAAEMLPGKHFNK